MKLIFLFCSIGLFVYMNLSAAHPNLKPYAEADEGMVRYVIELPELEDESLRQVELIVGQTVPTDGVNRHFFGGKITRETVQGWGFSYYELKAIGPMAGTLMAPHPNALKVDAFVPVRNDFGLLRYNSKLPLVVYVPEGVEVKYRLWSTDSEPVAAEVQ